MKNRKRRLAVRIVLTMLLGVSCQQVIRAVEHTTSYVTGGGKNMFEVLYFNKGDSFYVGQEKIVKPTGYDLSAVQKAGLEKGLSYWAEMLGPAAKNAQPVQILITTTEKKWECFGRNSADRF